MDSPLDPSGISRVAGDGAFTHGGLKVRMKSCYQVVLPIGYHEDPMVQPMLTLGKGRRALTCANTSGPRRARTDDLRIKSPQLYQLS